MNSIISDQQKEYRKSRRIAQCMLEQTLLDKGSAHIHQEIEAHPFEAAPYVIQYDCKLKEPTLLSQAVFNEIVKKVDFSSMNLDNMSKRLYDRRLDAYTMWNWKDIHTSNDVICTARFDNKEKMLNMIDELSRK